MSVCCDKDYFAECPTATGDNCNDNIAGMAKRTANGAVDDSESNFVAPLLANLLT